ncbi:MAG: MFS transporter [Alphaproteobacteria bacterium]
MSEQARGAAADQPAPRAVGLLHPLVHHSFALIAGATLISSIGVWMRDTTSAWTVAGHANGAASVALVQAATTLPTFLLALPAGVLADHFDRRLILILCQLVLAAVGFVLAGLSWLDQLSVGAIVVLAFIAGCAAALSAPAFQSIVPALVPPADLRPAVALSSVSFNIARVIGPSIGGVLLATSGAAATYTFNAVAYLVTIGALLALPSNVCPNSVRAPVAFRAELHQGFAYVAQSSPFRRLLARAAALYVCAACYLALTPAIAHDILGKSPGIYGVLLSAVGIGSLVGAMLMSTAKKRGIDDEILLIACSATGAVALALLSIAREPILASAALALAGAGTLIQLATFNATAQLLLPEAIRGRGLSIYMAATFGCMAVGSLLWGAIAQAFSISVALVLAAIGFAFAAVAGRFLPLEIGGRP